MANLHGHRYPLATRNERPNFKDLVADSDRLGFAFHRRKRRAQHAGADPAIFDVDLAFVQCVAALGEGLGFKICAHWVVHRHEAYSALPNKRCLEVDGNVDDITRIVHVLARSDIDSFDLHTGAAVRAGGGSTLR